MEKLKCESCGANLTIDEDNEYATCPYCGLKYKLKKDENLTFKLELDEDIKQTIKTGGKIALKVGFAHFIITSIISLIIIGVVIFGIAKIIVPEINRQLNDNTFEIESFNDQYEMYSGGQSKFFTEKLLDDVVTNNRKKTDKKITVVYNEISTANPDEITELKRSLQDKDYEVALDYDDNGYVNKITIKD